MTANIKDELAGSNSGIPVILNTSVKTFITPKINPAPAKTGISGVNTWAKKLKIPVADFFFMTASVLISLYLIPSIFLISPPMVSATPGPKTICGSVSLPTTRRTSFILESSSRFTKPASLTQTLNRVIQFSIDITLDAPPNASTI